MGSALAKTFLTLSVLFGLLNTAANASQQHALSSFCKNFKCKITYDWEHARVYIENPGNKNTAVFSRFLNTAIISGYVIRYKDAVTFDAAKGFLLPHELATALALFLGYGVLEKTSTAKTAEPYIKPVLNTLVIDPGHGGQDVGTNSSELLEKDITLIYALRFREKLLQILPDLKIHLTRETDKFVGLPERAGLANSKKADLFLSLHVNHSSDAKIQGVETFILSPDATDDDARQTAVLENDPFLKSVASGQSDLGKILADMEQTRYIQHSALVAAMIQQEVTVFDPNHKLRNRGVKQGMFYVLSQASMPSVLLEIGFLSNERDRKRMMNVKFQDEFIDSLVKAVIRYRKYLK